MTARLEMERDAADRLAREKETKILNLTSEVQEGRDMLADMERSKNSLSKELDELISSKDDEGKNVSYILYILTDNSANFIWWFYINIPSVTLYNLDFSASCTPCKRWLPLWMPRLRNKLINFSKWKMNCRQLKMQNSVLKWTWLLWKLNTIATLWLRRRIVRIRRDPLFDRLYSNENNIIFKFCFMKIFKIDLKYIINIFPIILHIIDIHSHLL